MLKSQTSLSQSHVGFMHRKLATAKVSMFIFSLVLSEAFLTMHQAVAVYRNARPVPITHCSRLMVSSSTATDSHDM